jgi:hypothetical protein
MTIQVFTDYQLSELDALFNSGARVIKLGICQEDNSLIAEYTCWRDTKTIRIYRSEAMVINGTVEKQKDSVDFAWSWKAQGGLEDLGENIEKDSGAR